MYPVGSANGDCRKMTSGARVQSMLSRTCWLNFVKPRATLYMLNIMLETANMIAITFEETLACFPHPVACSTMIPASSLRTGQLDQIWSYKWHGWRMCWYMPWRLCLCLVLPLVFYVDISEQNKSITTPVYVNRCFVVYKHNERRIIRTLHGNVHELTRYVKRQVHRALRL